MNARITEKYIKEGVFCINVRENYSIGTYDNDHISKARKYFYKEYYSFSVKIKRIEINTKKYLRMYLRPLHVILYKMKMIVKTNLYHR